MIKAVLMHFSVLDLPKSHKRSQELDDLIEYLKLNNIRIAILSTYRNSVKDSVLADRLVVPDAVVTQGQVGKPKGSDMWIRKTCEILSIHEHECLYLGGKVTDWRSAINTPTFYIQTTWSNTTLDNATTFYTESPHEIIAVLDNFLDRPAYYGYNKSSQITSTHIRCLLPANISLPSDTINFKLQEIFTYNREFYVNGNNVKHILMFHLLASLYAEGILNRYDGERPVIFTVYPSSNPDKTDTHFDEFISVVSKMFHGSFIPDIFERHTKAIDTSLERVNAKRENRDAQVGITVQSNSVIIRSKYKEKIQNRLVVVLDDFCTNGNSLDWARNLLKAAGVKRVVLASIGKYGGGNFTVYNPKKGVEIFPFKQSSYQDSDFINNIVKLNEDNKTSILTVKLFQKLKDRLPYPIEDI